ncbi:MAG: chromosome segregation protein SMC, partial [Methanobacteriota archaeon]
GSIAELGRVDPKYETALEVAAGGRMMAIVCDDDAAAARAIDVLKRRQLGRATFLPLNRMIVGRPQGKSLMVARQPDSKGYGIDLVKFDEKYRAAFWYVFRDTLIMGSLESARRHMGGVRMVTMDGDLVSEDGAMTGGSTPDGKNRLKWGAAAAASLDKAAKELRAAQTHQEALLSELSTVRDEIAELEGRLRDLSGESGTKTARIEELSRKKTEFATKLTQSEEEAETAKKDLASSVKQAEGLRAELTKIDRRNAELEAAREEKGKSLLKATAKKLADDLVKLQDDERALQTRVLEVESAQKTKEVEQKIVEERRGERERDVAAAEGKIAEEQKVVEEHHVLAHRHDEELRVLLSMEEALGKKNKELVKAKEKAYKAKVDLEGDFEKLRDKIDTAQDLVLKLEGEIPKLEAARAEIEAELSALGVPIPEKATEAVEDLKARVKSLEATLRALGDVNMQALQQFDDLSKRKQELETELARLEDQKKELVALVEEITARKKEGLVKVFDEIRKNFAEIFTKLSEGGEADLVLENKERPFDGGLLVQSRPKGKKVSRLELLSGGEKSLTALAFILAIQEYQPSPFYLFDEVDQNLDGINSELVARLIKGNSKRAQFLVVSLRKVTLKEADHVYGVTLTPSGLSEIVGNVKIDDIVEPSSSPSPSPSPSPIREVHAA